MKPRLYALRNRSDEVEAFNLDITEYKEACNADEYLAPAFENQYKYALRSLLFFPKRKVQRCTSTCNRSNILFICFCLGVRMPHVLRCLPMD